MEFCSTVCLSQIEAAIEKGKKDHRCITVGFFTPYKKNMGQILNNITSQGTVLTKLRPTMVRMTGAATPPISISS
jgi:hypothetical protein